MVMNILTIIYVASSVACAVFASEEQPNLFTEQKSSRTNSESNYHELSKENEVDVDPDIVKAQYPWQGLNPTLNKPQSDVKEINTDEPPVILLEVPSEELTSSQDDDAAKDLNTDATFWYGRGFFGVGWGSRYYNNYWRPRYHHHYHYPRYNRWW